MRRTNFLIFNLIIFVLSFVSCKSVHFSSHKVNMELKGNPTTGYSWEYIVEDDSIIQISEDVKYLGKKGIVGAPSLYTYTIKSLKPGKTTLRFEYKRYWEETDADELKLFDVIVKENGEITLKEKNEETVMNTYKSVSMTEGLNLMAEDADFILLDVRRPDEFAAGHIPGAVQLTNETFTEADAERIIPDKSKRVYVYCRSGRRSKQSSQKLVDSGYTNVIEIGGIIDYSGEIEK